MTPGEKAGEKIYEALLACVKRNTSDDEFITTMMYLIHKSVWELTADNDTADRALAGINSSAFFPVWTGDNERSEQPEASIDAEVAEDDSTDA